MISEEGSSKGSPEMQVRHWVQGQSPPLQNPVTFCTYYNNVIWKKEKQYLKICNNTVTKDLPPHLKCVATLVCEISSVLKATIENKTTSVTTHLKKLTTGNNAFIVSVIV